jgi:hypothetical protein
VLLQQSVLHHPKQTTNNKPSTKDGKRKANRPKTHPDRLLMDGIHYPRPPIPNIFQAKWAMLYLSSGLPTRAAAMTAA